MASEVSDDVIVLSFGLISFLKAEVGVENIKIVIIEIIIGNNPVEIFLISNPPVFLKNII
ncbi:MAG: hypothetical protein KHW62_05875 [Clostridiales bacterium]|nr:hypothetical protein [Clostridiales bacterium]